MLVTLVAAVGLVLVLEGLVFALAPGRIEDLLRLFAETPLETRRLIGLAAIASGLTLVALARVMLGA